MHPPPRSRLEALLAERVRSLAPLHGGMVASVHLATLDGGGRVVVKSSPGTPLAVEAAMLTYLARRTDLPVPAVLHAEDDLLVLEYLEGGSSFDASTEFHAAELLASLHGVRPEHDEVAPNTAESLRSDTGQLPRPQPPVPDRGAAAGHPGRGSRETSCFGFGFDTLIGPLPQPNAWAEDWPSFFRDRRIRPLVARCGAAGSLTEDLRRRLELLSDDLGTLLDHDPRPGLVHGDIWAGNVLAKEGKISGVLDPAMYFADPEVEIAFIELFDTFGDPFLERYGELRRIEPGYAESRRYVYQLYPLLVHLALFGSAYLRGVEQRLRRLGY